MTRAQLNKGHVEIVWVNINIDGYAEGMSACMMFEGEMVKDAPLTTMCRKPLADPSADPDMGTLFFAPQQGSTDNVVSASSKNFISLRRIGEILLVNWLHNKLRAEDEVGPDTSGLSSLSSDEDFAQLWKEIESRG